MADRKPTVLNPAGYQENLQDTDNLIVEAAPTADNHAVNKGYADTEIADAGKWEESSGKLYPKNLSNNVGIGTDSPSRTLEIKTGTGIAGFKQSTSSLATTLEFLRNGAGTSTNNAIEVSNSEGNVAHIAYDGSAYFNSNVGIGTDSPAANLEIANTPSPGVPTLYLSQAPSVSTTSDIALTGNAAIRSEASIRNVVNTGGFFSWLVGGDDNKAGTDGASEVVRITPVGNVGIGTDAPVDKLHISTSSNEKFLVTNPDFVQTTTGTSFDIGFGSATGNTYTDVRALANGRSTWGDLVLQRGGGNVGIGTESPEAKLTIDPGNSSTTSMGGRDIAYGVNAITTSGRSGFLVRNSNNYVQDNDNSAFQFLYPFNDGITSDYKVFRTAKGSTLSDVFWTSINGNGYFAGNVTAASFTGPVTGDITGDITGNINGNVVGDVTGNADTATKLKTARNINGTAFDGTSAITTAKWGTARNLNGVSVDGSADKTLEPYVERDDSSNTARYLTFVDNNTAGYKRLNMDTNLNYNPSLNRLYTNISGDAGTIDGLDSTQFLRSDANDTATGKITFDAGIRLNDNDVAEFGSSADYKVAYDGSKAIHNVTSGDFYFQNNGTSRIFFDLSEGDILPSTDNTGEVGTAANTWSNGRFTNFQVDSTLNVRGAIDLADNDILRFGSGDDAEFFTNGSHFYLDLNGGIGNFYIRDGTTTRFTFNDNGAFTCTGKLTAGNFDLESLPALP